MTGVLDRARMLATSGRVRGYMLAERVRKPRLRCIRDVPVHIEDITPEWLTLALCAGHPEARVRSIAVSGGSDATTSRRAIAVTYNDAGRQAGLPNRLFAKATPALGSRMICGPSGLLANETGFYRDLRREIEIEAPVALYADYHRRAYRSLILFADAAAEGATFCDPKNTLIDRARIEDMLGLMAVYHGHFHDDPRLDHTFTWLHTPLSYQQSLDRMLGFERDSGIGVSRAASVVPRGILDNAKALWPALLHSLELNGRKPRTFLHSDVHIGNWYMTAAGRMGLCDWQATVKGQWSMDVAYALSSALTSEDRRAWEADLLRFYIDRLQAAGGPKLSFEQAWLEYRQQILHGFFFWAFVIGASARHPEMQPPEMAMINISRMAAALDDLDTLGSLQA